MDYWTTLEELVNKHEIVIDRCKGQPHPRYPDFIYPVDYGFLKGTTAVDGNGIDIFVGSKKNRRVEGIICTVDTLKNDTEIKIMYACTDREFKAALRVLNNKYMRAIYVKRE